MWPCLQLFWGWRLMEKRVEGSDLRTPSSPKPGTVPGPGFPLRLDGQKEPTGRCAKTGQLACRGSGNLTKERKIFLRNGIFRVEEIVTALSNFQTIKLKEEGEGLVGVLHPPDPIRTKKWQLCPGPHRLPRSIYLPDDCSVLSNGYQMLQSFL